MTEVRVNEPLRTEISRSTPSRFNGDFRVSLIRTTLALDHNTDRRSDAVELSGSDFFGSEYRSKLDASVGLRESLGATAESAWMSKNFWQARETIFRTLSEHAYFIHLAQGMKRPSSFFSNADETEVNRSIKLKTIAGAQADWIVTEAPPAIGNYGIVPKPGSRLLIVDLDVPKAMSDSEKTGYLQDSIARIGEKLNVDLFRSALVQRSQSGGYHFFLLLPDYATVAQLPSGRFRGIFGTTSDGRAIEGDFRSGRSPGYVVGAGSLMSDSDGSLFETDFAVATDGRFKNFKLARKFTLPTLDGNVLSFLAPAALAAQKTAERAKRKAATGSSAVQVLRLNSSLAQELEQSVNSSKSHSYHAKRAFVYRATSCCGSNESIASLISSMGLDWDTYTNKPISRADLMTDMQRNAVKLGKSETHGRYCHIFGGRQRGQKKAARSSEPKVRPKPTRKQLRYKKRNTSVPNIVSLAVRLTNGRKRVSQARHDAFALGAGYFAPLASVGSTGILASREFLAGYTGLNQSRIHAALKLLRDVGFIEVKRRARAGATTLYSVNADLANGELTDSIRASWGASKVVAANGEGYHLPSFVDYRSRSLIRADGREYSNQSVISETTVALSTVRSLGFDVPRFDVLGLIQQYSKDILTEYVDAQKTVEPERKTAVRKPNWLNVSVLNLSDIEIDSRMKSHLHRGARATEISAVVLDPSTTESCRSGLDPPECVLFSCASSKITLIS